VSWLTDLMGGDGESEPMGDAFNDYGRVFENSTEPTDGELVKDMLGIRFRLFGDARKKQEAWEREHPEFKGSQIQWVSVSSGFPEIWGDLRQTKRRYEDGKPRQVFNHVAAGHELNHLMRVILGEGRLNTEDPNKDGLPLLSPDEYRGLK
jgi:hypothetical protein